MRLATLREGGPDGTLIVVAEDGARFARAGATLPCLQAALERWDEAEPMLWQVAGRLERDGGGEPLDVSALAAPLPRAWQWLDGSTYSSHGALMDQVIGVTPQKTGLPLMYQGVSDMFFPPLADVPMADEALGIDFEGEFGVLTDAVPMGVSSSAAAGHIRLVVQINDWSLRNLAGAEMKTGFGWIQAKPHSGMAPFAVTPDSLGAHWRQCRPALRLRVDWNGARFGNADGEQMAFGFDELVAHAARTRRLVAGTVVGGGTVSNPDFRVVGSSCIAERRGIEIVDEGKPRTEYMRFGDTVRMEAVDAEGRSPFGVIEQRVARP